MVNKSKKLVKIRLQIYNIIFPILIHCEKIIEFTDPLVRKNPITMDTKTLYICNLFTNIYNNTFC